MFTQAVYTVFWLVCLLVALFAAVALFQFLRKITVQESDKKEWYRYVAPTALAVFLALFFNDFGGRGVWQWIYLLLIAIGLPLALSFYFLRSNLEKKNERLLVIVAFLFLLNAGIFTALWSWHFRINHATNLYNGEEGENAQQENPHLSKRNWFLFPLWILTLVVSVGSRVMWKQTNEKEAKLVDNEYLPF